MKTVLVVACLSVCMLLSEALPASRALRTSRSVARQRQLVKDIMCLVKGLSLEECREDDSLTKVMDNYPPSTISAGSAANGLLPPPSRRDAFYSDWKRRK